jgi:hypothetical protein
LLFDGCEHPVSSGGAHDDGLKAREPLTLGTLPPANTSATVGPASVYPTRLNVT